ncbi:MAG: FAD-dependent oxidoreductase [Planctomycetota bacterium]|nr:FAD-dependent oxidoreductase [Planctomycetota bacterium]
MNRHTHCHGLGVFVAVAFLAACLYLGGCSPATKSNSATNASVSDPSDREQPEDRSPPTESRQSSDVIVVGAGISGLSAALELGRGGAQVTVIDMSSVFGGHAVMSQGSVSIVATPAQERAGIEDSPDLAFQDFHRWGEDPATDWVRYYVDHSRRDIYDWLDELGVRFSEVVASSGNSVPREHQPIGRGIGLVTPIYRACLELANIDFAWNTKAEQLLTDNGRVVGVLVRDMRTGGERELRGKAVILATGGFQSNLDMVREFWPAEFRFPERILAGSGRNSIGLGHQMTQAVGGELVHMDYQWNYFTGLPDPRYPGSNRGLNATNLYGILVNAEGRRFANFHGWAKEVMPILLKQQDATCWCIFDEVGKPFFSVSGSDWGDFKKVEKLILQDPDLVQKADTLERLAELAGLPVNNLVETVARYNELVEQGEDADFGRFGPGKREFSNRASGKIATPPFYAMQTFPLTRKSMGGVAIDLQCRVLDKQKQPIPGLYAVGELTGLAGINGKAALEGTFLGPCIVTGRVAASSLLKELEVPTRTADLGESRCTACHDIPRLLSQAREGYWHFEKVHRATEERGLDCRHCHSELTPFRDDDHRINRQSLTASCVLCHVAQE